MWLSAFLSGLFFVGEVDSRLWFRFNRLIRGHTGPAAAQWSSKSCCRHRTSVKENFKPAIVTAAEQYQPAPCKLKFIKCRGFRLLRFCPKKIVFSATTSTSDGEERLSKPQGTWCQAMAAMAALVALVAMPHFPLEVGEGHNEDRTWLANLLCKRKYGISLPRQCRRRSNRNSFQPAGKKGGQRTPGLQAVMPAKYFENQSKSSNIF